MSGRISPSVTLRTSALRYLPLTALRLRRSLAWPVGQAEAELTGMDHAPAPGTTVIIEAAVGTGSPERLFTGRVLGRLERLGEIRLLIEEETGALARLQLEKPVRLGTVARAVSDLCRAAGVEAVVDPLGSQISDAQLLGPGNAMEQLLHLARRSGWLIATDVLGRLRAGPPPTMRARPCFRRTVALAGLPPADLGELVALNDLAEGAGLARVVSLEVLWSAAEGLLTRLDLFGQ